MAEKKEGKSIKGEILKAFMSNIAPLLREGVQGAIKKMQDVVYHTQKKVTEHVFASVTLMVGFIFIAIALILFINDYFMLPRYMGFAIVGCILVIIACLFRIYIGKTKYKND